MLKLLAGHEVQVESPPVEYVFAGHFEHVIEEPEPLDRKPSLQVVKVKVGANVGFIVGLAIQLEDPGLEIIPVGHGVHVLIMSASHTYR